MQQKKKGHVTFQILVCFTVMLALVTSVLATETKRVILIETMPVPAVLEHSKWFQIQLQELGYEAGKNLHLTVLKANGDRQLAETLLSAELAKEQSELIATIATLASQTAVKLLKYTQTLLENSNVPIVLGTKLDSVKMGALMHVTPNLEASGRETALLADKILKGEDPGQIPVAPPLHFDVGLNLTTALRLKIVIPPDMLQLAGEHVYR